MVLPFRPGTRSRCATVSESKAATERREIYFSGRVQGVGFRYTAREIAARYAVRGWVQNLPDGRVLVVVEGGASTLDRFLAAVTGEMDRYIDHAETAVLPATQEFASFEVRR
jgi:acylphosphatase